MTDGYAVWYQLQLFGNVTADAYGCYTRASDRASRRRREDF